MMDIESVKCVVVGDGSTGKTSMLVSFSTNSFPETHVPTVFDNYMCQVMWNRRTVSLQLWDTAGQEDYDKLRPLSYPETDVFLVVFDISNMTSLENIKHKWAPEIRNHCPNTPLILVGNKSDLRDNLEVMRKVESMITQDQALHLSKEIGCVDFCECSAKTQHGLKQLFDRAIQAVLAPKTEVNSNSSKRKCLLM